MSSTRMCACPPEFLATTLSRGVLPNNRQKPAPRIYPKTLIRRIRYSRVFDRQNQLVCPARSLPSLIPCPGLSRVLCSSFVPQLFPVCCAHLRNVKIT